MRLHLNGDVLDCAPRHLIVAGYTGRDERATRAHIEELAAIGVPEPPTVPAFYRLDPALLTTEPAIAVDGGNTSGEVEPVLIRHRGRHYLGVGSDHTDRDIERADVGAAKAACPKPLGDRVVALPDDTSWDAIRVESSVDGRRYQSGRLSALRTPADLLGRLAGALGDLDGDLVVFAGTLPLLDGAFVPGSRWRLALTVDTTTLTCHYETKRRAS
ncbi:DUF2848 family protein [Actinomadura rubrisoli]|uniref:DUF2848 domain-containing protein n=1 Tax=Actinomadura rubrisoli TaxID=2530368 RepID=A0A4R5BJU8_9ACTN|nr:DUF2848 family protein [Actinomadura rubrisoli]TDD85919.1 DUF2848 domain-containing protein [Actinomadura rubrisoli]